MTDLVTALGLVLVIEGLLFAAFPGMAQRSMRTVADAPSDYLRLVGLVSAVGGVIVVYAIRGFFS